MHEGEGGVEGRESAGGCEQRAARAAHEAEGDDGDEAMAGKENVLVQRADGGSGLIGVIKNKRPHRKRAKGDRSHRQRQEAARPG